MSSLVIYQGIACELLVAEEVFPAQLQIISPNDISKAMQIGFSCWGYPNEIMKEVTPEEDVYKRQDLYRDQRQGR